MASKKTNTALGVLAVAGAALGAYFLFGRSASAAEPSEPSEPGEPSQPGGGGGGGGGGGSSNGVKRAPGHPPPYGAGCRDGQYNKAFWDAGSDEQVSQRLDQALSGFGYYDRSAATIRRFQEDYNIVSRAGNLLDNMGGLDMDGVIGPCTLNGLKYLLDNLDFPAIWPPAVQSAEEGPG